MTTSNPSLAAALAGADLLFDRAALESVIVDMGRDIDAALDGERAVHHGEKHGAFAIQCRIDVAAPPRAASCTGCASRPWI